MAPPFAFVTLVTSDSYLPGALVLLAALREVEVNPQAEFQTVCLVTPETLDVRTIKELRNVFDVVVGVEVIQEDSNRAGLNLLGRPDLHAVLTKLHVFRLTQYQKIIYLDADVLPLRPLSHLFTLPHSFSAVPDVGWPDIFNSGFMVLEPGEDKFNDIMSIVHSKGSWDGGDQGVLNEWRGEDWHRLSFIYNTTPTAAYTYAPAYERFGSNISNIHFIGPKKPWASIPYRAPIQHPSSSSLQSYAYPALVDRWFAVYDRNYRTPRPSVEQYYQVQKYDAVWDSTSPTDVTTEGVLGLEELKAIAIHGVGSFAPSQKPRQPLTSGEYRTLPLDGRVDLMRPIKVLIYSEDTEQTPTYKAKTLDPAPEEENRLLESPESQQQQYQQKFQEYQQQQQQYQQYQRQPQHKAARQPSPQPTTTHLYPRARSRSPQPTLRQSPRPQSPQRPLQHVHFGSPESRLSPTLHTTLLPGSTVVHSPIPVSHYDQAPVVFPQQHHDEIVPPPLHHQDSGLVEHHHDVQTPPRENSPPLAYVYHTHDEHPHPYRPPLSPPRPPSPPLIRWDPAKEPPPKDTPSLVGLTVDSYYTNQWDLPVTPSHRRNFQSGVEIPESFFEPPPRSQIPHHLVQEGHYTAVISSDLQPQPDWGKVTPVFPWEQRPRRVPGRIFPHSSTPPPGLPMIPIIPPLSPTGPAPPTYSPPKLSPQYTEPGFPTAMVYTNAWDEVPGIQRYAARLIRPPPAPPPITSWVVSPEHFKSWEERAEASSRDGDDEDEEDEDDEGENGVDKKSDGGSLYSDRTGDGWNSSKRSISGSPLGRRTQLKGRRSGPTPGPSKGKEYCDQAVQTIPIETKSQGVQVSITTAPDPPKQHRVHHSKVKSPPTKGNLPLIKETSDWTKSQEPLVTSPQGLQGLSLSGMGSPRLGDSYSTSPMVHGRIGTPPLHIRTFPNDLGTPTGTSSPASTSPVEFPRRVAGRTWDPARGVEVFKKGSEEVLARFLRMGSWDEQSHTRKGPGSPTLTTPIG